MRIHQILQNNGYPKVLINKLINLRQHRTQISQQEKPTKTLPAYKSIMYVKGLSETISRIIKKYFDVNISYSPIRSSRKFFTKKKDKTPKELQSKLIYSIPCSCGMRYIGMTWKQYFKTRRSQHNSNQNNLASNKGKTALVDHIINDPDHKFNTDAMEIIDKNNNYTKLKWLESLHFYCNNSVNNDCVNYRTDVSDTMCQ